MNGNPCKCIDCGGMEPAHSSDCTYMKELHGANQVTPSTTNTAAPAPIEQEGEMKTTHDMTRQEFQEWAAEICVDAVITGGFRELKSQIALVIQQQMMIYGKNGGFQEPKK